MGKIRRSFSGCALVTLLLAGYQALGQDVYPKPAVRFTVDTGIIASPVRVVMVVRHSARMPFLLPDSSYNFSPFEVRSVRWFPSHTRDTTTTDSAVYELLSFSTAPKLGLSLPAVYLTPSGDSVVIYSDSAYYTQRDVPKPAATATSDTLIGLAQPLPIAERFNYTYWLLGAAGVAGVLLLLNFFLGRPLERWFKLLLLSRRHKFFIKAFDRLVEQVSSGKEAAAMERALVLWKSYIERLEEIPYSTYTTRDFAREMPEASLTRSLQTIDRWVYGGFEPRGVDSVFSVLKRFASRVYTRKREEVRNGKPAS